MKDGSNVENGMSALLSYPSAPAISLNISSVSLRVFATIKSFITAEASEIATSADMLSDKKGERATLYISVKVGCIMNNDKNNAMAMST